jgi:hypothetical protein
MGFSCEVQCTPSICYVLTFRVSTKDLAARCLFASPIVLLFEKRSAVEPALFFALARTLYAIL